MKGWMILLLVLAILFLLSLVRVGAECAYGAQGLRLALRMGAFRIRLFPPKKGKRDPEKNKPAKKAKKKKQEDKAETPRKKVGTLSVLRRAIPIVTDAAGRLRRKIRIDELSLTFTSAAAGNPALAAIGYGAVNAACGVIWPMLDNSFNIKKHEIRTGVDYDASQPSVELATAATLTIGQGVALSVLLAVRALKLLLEIRREQRAQTPTN